MEPLPAIAPQILARLDAFVHPVVCFAMEGSQRRALARTYVRGLLGSSPRKNVEQIVRAERGAGSAAAHEKRMTAMLRDGAWAHDRLMWEGASRLLAHDDGWSAYTIDDTACIKQGKHSVGVQVQYAGCVGHTANCQVLVTFGVAQEHVSAPMAAQLFLPQAWAKDAARRARCGVPDTVAFRTKTQIALDLARRVDLDGLPRLPVLADSAYGDVVAFRDALTARGFPWVVGLGLSTTVWPSGLSFEPVPQRSHRGRPAVRVRPAHGWNHGGISPESLCEEAWLLLHWPDDEPAPTKAWLASLSPETPLETLVGLARLRWRVERDNREGKGLAGLDHYEGRTWQGVHHHAALVVLAQQFLATERLASLTPRALSPPSESASAETPATHESFSAARVAAFPP